MSFKVGDKVRLKPGDFVSEHTTQGLSNKDVCVLVNLELGKIYTVENATEDKLWVNGLSAGEFIDRFELAEPPKFKVGDKVRLKDGSYLPKSNPAHYANKDLNRVFGVKDGEIYEISNYNAQEGLVELKEKKYFRFQADRFKLATEEIKVGDVYFLEHLGVVKVYDTSLPYIGIRIQLENGTLIYVSPELLKGKTPTGHRNRVPSVGKNLFEPKQHICMPRNAGRNLAMEQIAGALFNKTGYIKVWNGKEWEWLAAPAPHPTVTKIIHNGTTTITFFSDGKKVITRPSQDDLEKYDPFIGWCVGVVEHLYGGKEKAKKFYKKHAVVQKVARKAAEPIGTPAKKESVYHTCFECKYEKSKKGTEPCESCVADYIKSGFKTSIGWEPKENSIDTVIAEIKAIEKERECYVPKSCKTCRYRNASNLEEPCESCYNYSHWIEPIKI